MLITGPGGGEGGGGRRAQKGDAKLIALSVPEVRVLLLRLVWPPAATAEDVLAWSEWRRAHQYRARRCHYRARGADPPK